jgi:CBS-domain-containing membrane protein
MAVLLGALTWLDLRGGGIFLVPPFATTRSILLYLPSVSIAQPFAVVFGSVVGAAIGTVLSMFLGFGPGVAMVAALTAASFIATVTTIPFMPDGCVYGRVSGHDG